MHYLPTILSESQGGVNWKMGLDFLGLGIRNQKVNFDWDYDYETRQYWEFLYIGDIGIGIFDHFSAEYWDSC